MVKRQEPVRKSVESAPKTTLVPATTWTPAAKTQLDLKMRSSSESKDFHIRRLSAGDKRKRRVIRGEILRNEDIRRMTAPTMRASSETKVKRSL